MERSPSLREQIAVCCVGGAAAASVAMQAAAASGADFVRWKLAKFVSLPTATVLEPWFRFVIGGLTIGLVAVTLHRVQLGLRRWLLCCVVGVLVVPVLAFVLAEYRVFWVFARFQRAPYEWMWKVGSVDMLDVFFLTSGPASILLVQTGRRGSAMAITPEQARSLTRWGWAVLIAWLALHVAIWFVQAIVRNPSFAEGVHNVSIVADALATCGAGVLLLGSVLWSIRRARSVTLLGLSGAVIAAGAFSRLLHHLARQ